MGVWGTWESWADRIRTTYPDDSRRDPDRLRADPDRLRARPETPAPRANPAARSRGRPCRARLLPSSSPTSRRPRALSGITAPAPAGISPFARRAPWSAPEADRPPIAPLPESVPPLAAGSGRSAPGSPHVAGSRHRPDRAHGAADTAASRAHRARTQRTDPAPPRRPSRSTRNPSPGPPPRPPSGSFRRQTGPPRQGNSREKILARAHGCHRAGFTFADRGGDCPSRPLPPRSRRLDGAIGQSGIPPPPPPPQ